MSGIIVVCLCYSPFPRFGQQKKAESFYTLGLARYSIISILAKRMGRDY